MKLNFQKFNKFHRRSWYLLRLTRHTHKTTSQRQLDLKGTGFPWTAKCSVLRIERRYLKKGAQASADCQTDAGQDKGQAGSGARLAATHRGWENRSRRRTSLPLESARPPVGRAGRRGRREAGTRAGRGLEGSADSRWRHGWGVSYVDIWAQGLLVRLLVLKYYMVSRGVERTFALKCVYPLCGKSRKARGCGEWSEHV